LREKHGTPSAIKLENIGTQRTNMMNTYKKSSLAIAAAALSVTTSWAMLSAPKIEHRAAVILHANNAAYRDGLYQAKMDAADGARSKPSVGRWSTDKDRSAFLEGYRDEISKQ
jgi:hypothetical protein